MKTFEGCCIYYIFIVTIRKVTLLVLLIVLYFQTNVGDILLAVNPYKELQLYDKQVIYM